jgi:hypothetical protein
MPAACMALAFWTSIVPQEQAGYNTCEQFFDVACFFKKRRVPMKCRARAKHDMARAFTTMPRIITRAPHNLKVACFLLVKRMPIY